MTPSHRTTRRFGWRTLAPTGLGAALAVAVAASLTGGGGGLALPGGSPSRPAGATGTPTELDDAAPVSLNTFDDCAALLDHYRSTALPDVGPWGLGGPSQIMARGVGVAIGALGAAADAEPVSASGGATTQRLGDAGTQTTKDAPREAPLDVIVASGSRPTRHERDLLRAPTQLSGRSFKLYA